MCDPDMTTPASTAAVKDSLRQAALARRDTLDATLRAEAAETIAARELPVVVPPGTVVSGFMPIRSEINPLPLMRRFAEAGASLALPAIAGREKPLIMRAWTLGAPLTRGQWGIREPGPEAPEQFPDIVIAPLAAFDRRGYRIGYGGRYYDLTLAALRSLKPVIAIGIGFAAQEIDAVPTLPHDQRLDLVLTEREVIDCRGGR
jgi:5-formyltetrahydrofolate cyclo-ligase